MKTLIVGAGLGGIIGARLVAVGASAPHLRPGMPRQQKKSKSPASASLASEVICLSNPERSLH